MAWANVVTAQSSAAVYPNPATPYQVVGLQASVAGDSCRERVQVVATRRTGNEVLVEYRIVPFVTGCFIPTSLALVTPLGNFDPGTYRVRTEGPGRTSPVDVTFVVDTLPISRPYARLELLAGDRQIIESGRAPSSSFTVRAVDQQGRPVAGIQLLMTPSLAIGWPMRVDQFGYWGFNLNPSYLLGIVTADRVDPRHVVTTNAQGIATGGLEVWTFRLPSAFLFGVGPWPNLGAVKPQFFSVVVPGVSPGPGARVVVEYVNENNGNFFITLSDREIELLDAGRFDGWTRSIGSFIAYPDAASAPPGSVPVCRFFSASFGSHFYSADPVECAEVARKWPNVWALETEAAFYVQVPDRATATCPGETRPVFRLFNRRPMGNHRYVTDAVLRDVMMNAGWAAEGVGPGSVAMCTPG